MWILLVRSWFFMSVGEIEECKSSNPLQRKLKVRWLSGLVDLSMSSVGRCSSSGKVFGHCSMLTWACDGLMVGSGIRNTSWRVVVWRFCGKTVTFSKESTGGNLPRGITTMNSYRNQPNPSVASYLLSLETVGGFQLFVVLYFWNVRQNISINLSRWPLSWRAARACFEDCICLQGRSGLQGIPQTAASFTVYCIWPCPDCKLSFFLSPTLV